MDQIFSINTDKPRILEHISKNLKHSPLLFFFKFQIIRIFHEKTSKMLKIENLGKLT